MQIKVSYDNIDTHIRKWCILLDKYFPINNKELEIVIYLVKKQIDYTKRGLKTEEINELMLSTSMRKDISEELKIAPKTLNTYINLLRGNKVLVGNTIHSKLIPQSNLTFIFDGKE